MPHIEVPVQAGDDDVLDEMNRGYTADDYRRLVERIRGASRAFRLPQTSSSVFPARAKPSSSAPMTCWMS